MYSSFQPFYMIILGLLYLSQVIAANAATPRRLSTVLPGTTVHSKATLKTLRGIQLPNSLTKDIPNSKLLKKEPKIHRRDIPFQEPLLELIPETKGKAALSEADGTPKPQLPVPPARVPVLKPLARSNETEAERAERIHRSFERLLTFVEIVGQVDNYVSTKWKNLVRTVSNFYEVEDEPYHVSAKRVYGTCPHSQ